MESLLKHMVDMTGHRDHAMLDISVISAVQELARAAQTRVLSIVTIGGQRFLRSRASIGSGRCARADEPLDAAPLGDPMEHFPELAQCLDTHADSVETVADDACHTLWLPIWFGDKADTVLEIMSDGPFARDTLHTVSGIVGVYRNFHGLLAYSERDSLTGLLNRKTFDDELARMLQAVNDANLLLPGQPERRHAGDGDEEQQWLAVVDVDHFKTVNDRFGHLYGDEVLILIANLLTSSFRAQDRVFRFGGEEFVILLRSTTLANAYRLIERFRANVAEHLFPQVGTVTVSCGFVHIRSGESPVVSLGHADQALYFAKSHGRNQVCHYDELVANGQLQAVASNDTAEFF